MKVHYEPGQPPWIGSRLQDFFGMRETPTVGARHGPGRGAPARSQSAAVQMTSDLAGFWQRLYPQVRKELRAATPGTPGPKTRWRESHYRRDVVRPLRLSGVFGIKSFRFDERPRRSWRPLTVPEAISTDCPGPRPDWD